MKKIILTAVFLYFTVTMWGQETFDGVVLRTDLQTFVKNAKSKGYIVEKQNEGSCVLSGEYMMKYAGQITVEIGSDSSSILEISGIYKFESEEEAQKAFQDIFETQKINYQWARQGEMSCMAKSRRFMVVMYFETQTSLIIKLHLNELPPLRTVYCEILGVMKLNGKLTVEIDFGQKIGSRRVFSDSDNVLKDDKGNTIEFNSMIDAMNYMSTLGWEFVNAYAITEAPGSHVYHWLLKKMIREGDPINENIKTKADFK